MKRTDSNKKKFNSAKKLGLMGKTKEAELLALEAISGWERQFSCRKGHTDTHISLFRAYYFIGDRDKAKHHLKAYIQNEEKAIEMRKYDQDNMFFGTRFRVGFLQGKKSWLHWLQSGHYFELRKYFQDLNDRIGTWIFDIDGTLLEMDGYSWQLLDQAFNFTESNAQICEQYKAGHLSHATWCDTDLRVYQALGLNKEKFEKIFSDIKPSKGAIETISALKKAGKKLVIISGGFENTLSGKIPIELFDEMHVNRLNFSKNGILQSWSLTAFGDGLGKRQGLNQMKYSTKNSSRFCAYVGDNDNDLEIFKHADLAIAFNPKTDRIRKAADIVIEDDMREILKYV